MTPKEDQLTNYPPGAPEGNENDSSAQQQADFAAEAEATANQTPADPNAPQSTTYTP